jgi:hypothetical protein
VILAINDAGAVMEDLGYEPITMIQDLYDHFRLPKAGPLLVRDSAAYKFLEGDIHIFSKQALGMTNNRATSVYAVAMAAIMGCKKAIMIGFDSITTGSLAYSQKAANPANRGNRNHVINCQKDFLKGISIEKGIELEYITSVKDLEPEEDEPLVSLPEDAGSTREPLSSAWGRTTEDVDSPEEEESDTHSEPDLPCTEGHDDSHEQSDY